MDRIVSQPRRADSFVKGKGMLVNPVLLDAAMAADARVRDHQVRLLRTAPADPFSMDELTRVVGITSRVVRVRHDALVDPGRAWKTNRFVDLGNRRTWRNPSPMHDLPAIDAVRNLNTGEVADVRAD